MELCSGGSGGSGVDSGCSEAGEGGGCLGSHTADPADACESVLGLGAPDFPTSTIQCLSSGPVSQQVLSDQLLSGSVTAVADAAAEMVAVSGGEEVTAHGRMGDGDETDSHADADAAAAVAAVAGTEEGIIYEGLGEEETQDWSCLESLISESRMELLDLCSRSELAVNLFCEEDVENYMFQEEDAGLSAAGEVCSLKIRYESFAEGLHDVRGGDGGDTDEDALAPQDVQQQLNFFSTCPTEERDALSEKPEPWSDLEPVGGDAGATLSTTTPLISPASQTLFDFSSSPGESAEFSDGEDDSSCTGSSPDTWLAGARRGEHGGNLSRENSSSSGSQRSYRLRAKRKVAFREDYLYDVDSIEGERNADNRAEKNNKKKSKKSNNSSSSKALKVGTKGEKDDDWCPKKKQRKSQRKDPPVIIKYIIINRFKGVKHMTVKLGRVDSAAGSVCLSEGSLTQYEKLAPLKDFWQSQTKEQMALGSTKATHLNGCKVSPSSGLKKRRHRITKRLRIQRVHAMEKPPAPDNGAQEAACQVKRAKPETSTGANVTEAGSLLYDRPVGQGGPRRRAMMQESDDRCDGDKPIRVRKFRSEARLRAAKLAEAQARLSMEQGNTAKEGGSVCGTPCGSSTSSPQDTKVITSSSNAADKCTFTLNPQGGATSANVAPLPGGYLQTLLETSDSSSSACTSYFPLPQQQPQPQAQPQPQPSQPFLLGVPPFHPPQSCVLSPPSESELPQSPNSHGCYPAENQQAQAYTADPTAAGHNADISYPTVWPSQPGETGQLPFQAAALPSQSPMLPSGFPKQTLLTDDRKATIICYHGVSSDGDSRDITPSEESLDPEHQHQHQNQQLLDLEYRLSPGGGQCQGQGQDGVVVGRLVSFDSLGSLSVASSNYSSLSLHDGCEGEAEEGEMSDNFLSHCSPQLVLQQSLEEVTPLRESTDLLDISNFTPDKFRHTSLSDMSPPDTPSPSPRLIRQGAGFTAEPGSCEGGHWECGVVSSEVEDANGSRHTHLLQIHSFGPDEDGDDEANGKDQEGFKGQKGPKRKCAKSGPKKMKSPKAAKQGEQGTKSTRKIKAILEGKANKGGGGAVGSQSPSAAMGGLAGEWPGVGSLSDDDQQEFKEPSNILSNIVSGMAEVQRFMQASVEPLWGPSCSLPGEQALQSQTLRILGGPFDAGKKRGGANGVGRGKKGAGSKNPPKLIPVDLFPALGLDCFPVPHRPAHKKMYRHKSSAKFAREGLALSKGNAKVSALTATLEKQR